MRVRKEVSQACKSKKNPLLQSTDVFNRVATDAVIPPDCCCKNLISHAWDKIKYFLIFLSYLKKSGSSLRKNKSGKVVRRTKMCFRNSFIVVPRLIMRLCSKLPVGVSY